MDMNNNTAANGANEMSDIYWTLKLTGKGSRSLPNEMPISMLERYRSEYATYAQAQRVGSLIVEWASDIRGLSFTVVSHVDDASDCSHGIGCRHDW